MQKSDKIQELVYQKEKLFTNIKSMSNTVILFDPIRLSCQYEWVGASYFLNNIEKNTNIKIYLV